MSGIFGIFNLSGKAVNPEALSRAVSSMSRRGPDGVHAWRLDNVGMGHCRLSVSPAYINVEQPYRQAKTGIVIVGDARIDNRDELSRQLVKDAQVDLDHSDAEIILLAYRKWGWDCPQHLDGDFAFAIWDPARQQFFLARDHIGTRPLYYFHSRELFAFASEIKALLSLPEVSSRVDDLRIIEYLTGLDGDKESTFYQDISRLPPASWMVVSGDGLQVHTYWRLADAPDIRFSTDDAYANALLEILSGAVARRVNSTYPVGLALSGGLDSTSIVCLVEEILSKHSEKVAVHTFSAVFPDLPATLRPRVDEGDYIQKVLPQLTFADHQVIASAVGPLANAKTVLSILDEPFFAPTLEIFWALYAEAAKTGCRVYLEGFDGDATVSHGIDRFPEMLLRFQWLSLLSEARDFARCQGDASSIAGVLRRFALKPALRYLFAYLPFGIRTRVSPPFSRFNFLREDIRLRHLPADKLTNKPGPRSKGTYARQMHLKRLALAEIPRGLEVTNHIASYHHLEARFPFFDRKLMEYCVGVPVEQKLANGKTRAYFRRALKGVVPEAIRLRMDKADFDVYFNHLMLVHQRNDLDALVASDSKPIFEYIDRKKVQYFLKMYYNNPVGMGAGVENLYATLILSLWLDKRSTLI